MLEQVFGDERTRSLETVDVYVTTIDPKHTSKLIKSAVQRYPLDHLDHLKRVKREKADKGINLWFLLSTVSSATLDELESFLSSEQVTHNTISVVPVSRYPAITRSQFEEWKKLWPMSFHDTLARIDQPLTDNDIAIAHKWMQTTLEQARTARSDGLHFNAAIMVDPVTGSQIASSRDNRRAHPLEHATMNCIAEVAERERTRRSTLADEGYEDGDLAQGSDQLDNGNDTKIPDIGASKKRKLRGEVGDETLVGAAIASAGKSGYLCTGLDLYVVDEPCSMCAMALVHSRIGRVFYAKRQPHGGLGSAYKIHAHPSLNHHYKVYRDLCAEEVEVEPTEKDIALEHKS